jgi:hypothetical protein
MKVFLLHCKKLSERLEIVELILRCSTVETLKIICTEPQDSDEGILHSTTQFRPNVQYIEGFPTVRPLRYSERSVFAKHYEALREIRSSKDKFFLILEDDTFFRPFDLDRLVSDIYSQIEVRPDLCNAIIFIGSGIHSSRVGEGIFRQTSRLKSRCADSYFVSPNAASIICKHLETDGYSYPYDWELNSIFLDSPFPVYWVEPPVVTQGSQSGRYQSAIQL